MFLGHFYCFKCVYLFSCLSPIVKTWLIIQNTNCFFFSHKNMVWCLFLRVLCKLLLCNKKKKNIWQEHICFDLRDAACWFPNPKYPVHQWLCPDRPTLVCSTEEYCSFHYPDPSRTWPGSKGMAPSCLCEAEYTTAIKKIWIIANIKNIELLTLRPSANSIITEGIVSVV